MGAGKEGSGGRTAIFTAAAAAASLLPALKGEGVDPVSRKTVCAITFWACSGWAGGRRAEDLESASGRHPGKVAMIVCQVTLRH